VRKQFSYNSETR